MPKAANPAKRSYFEKLRDPRWQKCRLEIMERDGFKCRACGSDAKTLNVHHGYYEKDADPWDYPGNALVTLCESCHEMTERRKKMVLEYVTLPRRMMEVVRLIDLLTANGPFGPAFPCLMDSLIQFSESCDTEVAGEYEPGEGPDFLNHVGMMNHWIHVVIADAERTGRETRAGES